MSSADIQIKFSLQKDRNLAHLRPLEKNEFSLEGPWVAGVGALLGQMQEETVSSGHSGTVRGGLPATFRGNRRRPSRQSLASGHVIKRLQPGFSLGPSISLSSAGLTNNG